MDTRAGTRDGQEGWTAEGQHHEGLPDGVELAKRILTDPDVQDQMLQQARAGTLHPSTMRDLMHIYGGRPAYKMDVPRVSDPDDEAQRAAIKAMPKEKRRLMMDLIREANVLAEQAKQRALPERSGAP